MIRELMLRWALNRKPDFVIGGNERPYLRRHWLLPRNPVFNIYVHQFLRSDDDWALHDHPWLFNASWILQGQYIEHTACEHGCHQFKELRVAGDWKFRWGKAPHRVELLAPRVDEADRDEHWARPFPCWTVFITGPRVRQWGFYCDKGWVHWKKFTAADDSGEIGAGCDA